MLDVGNRSRRFRRLRETDRARRVATVGEVEVVRCITSRSDQTGKYFSYRGEVLLKKMYHFGLMSRLGKRLELTIIKILISVSRQQHRASRPPSAAVFRNFMGTLFSRFGR